MTFRADFWVATATVAPVIALSAAVAVSDNFRLVARFEASLIRGTRSYIGARKAASSAYYISGINIAAQSLALFVSLVALGNEKDFVPPVIVIFAETFGLMAIWAGSIRNSAVGLAISRSPEEDRKPENGRIKLASRNRKSVHEVDESNNDDADG